MDDDSNDEWEPMFSDNLARSSEGKQQVESANDADDDGNDGAWQEFFDETATARSDSEHHQQVAFLSDGPQQPAKRGPGRPKGYFGSRQLRSDLGLLSVNEEPVAHSGPAPGSIEYARMIYLQNAQERRTRDSKFLKVSSFIQVLLVHKPEVYMTLQYTSH